MAEAQMKMKNMVRIPAHITVSNGRQVVWVPLIMEKRSKVED